MAIVAGWPRRRFLALAVAAPALSAVRWGELSGATAAEPDAANTKRAPLDAGLQRAVEFLLAKRSRDGVWHSETYGPLKDGKALSPLVDRTLRLYAPGPLHGGRSRSSAEYLLALSTDADLGTSTVYIAANAAAALSSMEFKLVSSSPFHEARKRFLERLKQHQHGAALGWQQDDWQFGGWGYSAEPPRKPEAPAELAEGTPAAPGNALAEPNLSVTRFAVEALRAAGTPADDPILQNALAFVDRLQNFSPGRVLRRFHDGGFFFIYGDSVRNKAGLAGIDHAGTTCYASYGSTTADGLTVMLLCGRPLDHPRVAAALGWLRGHEEFGKQPGDFAKDREFARNAGYFYYLAGLAGALQLASANSDKPPFDPRWPELLADALLSRQRADGSWSNEVVDLREDDPLIATSFAVRALTICRAQRKPIR